MSKFSQLIEFGEWAPDQPQVASFARTVRNALTNGRYYRPLPKEAEIGDALPDICKGAGSFVASDGNTVTTAGTETDLYLYNNESWDSATRVSGGSYATTQENRWQFDIYGDRLLATNFDDDIQTLLIGTDTNYSQLSASAPRAKHITIINNFIMVGNTDVANNQVAWSGLDAPTTWGTNIALQADSQLLENGQGEVRGLFGNQNYGAILQQKGIVRAEYVGPPNIFRFTDIERNRGASTHYGNASLGNTIFFLEESGFYRFDGTNSTNISENRVSRWFETDYDSAYSFNTSCVIDPVNTIAVWGYADKNATGGLPNKVIIYDWVDNRWTYGDFTHELLFRALTIGYTLDGLDAVSTNLDTLPFSLDSSVWKGGKTVLGSFSSNSKLAYLTGLSRECTVETAEIQLNPSGRSMVSGIYLQSDASDYDITVSSRNLPSETPVESSPSTVNALTGNCDFAIDSRYHRATVTIGEDDDWTELVGIKAEFEETGKA